MKLRFAEIDVDGVVSRVLVGRSADWLQKNLGGVWIETSSETRGGVHYTDGLPSEDQTKALRFNYAGIGFTYDEERDAFIPPKPYESWVLNEDTCLWVAPLPYPDDEGTYTWNEELFAWELVEVE